MVINSVFICDFVDLDPRIEAFFEKGGVAENGATDYEIGDIGTSASSYWRLKKISCRVCLLFYHYFCDKK